MAFVFLKKRERIGRRKVDTDLGLICDVCLAQFGDEWPSNHKGTLASGNPWPPYNFCPICGQPAKEPYDSDAERLIFLTVFGELYRPRELINIGAGSMRITRIEVCKKVREPQLSPLAEEKFHILYEVYAKPIGKSA